MSFDTAMTLIQLGALVTVFVALIVDRRRDTTVRDFARLQHDTACEGGKWPHPGACMPKGRPSSEQELVSWVMLGQSTALGAGRLPVAMLCKMEIPSPIKSNEEDSECNGAD